TAPVSPPKPRGALGKKPWLGFASAQMKSVAIAKKIASGMKAGRSNTCTRVCRQKATATSTRTITAGDSQDGTPSNADSAKAPLTLLTANHPTPAVMDIRPAGRMLPRKPKAERPCTIWGTPNLGPQLERTACDSAPSALPTTTARATVQKL